MNTTKSVFIMATSLALFTGIGITIMRMTKEKAAEVKPTKPTSKLVRFLES